MVKSVKNYQDSRIINGKINSIMNYAEREGLNITKSEIQDVLRGYEPERLKEIIDANILEYRAEREQKDRKFETKYGYSPSVQRQATSKQVPQRNTFRDGIRYASSSQNTNYRANSQRQERNSNEMER